MHTLLKQKRVKHLVKTRLQGMSTLMLPPSCMTCVPGGVARGARGNGIAFGKQQKACNSRRILRTRRAGCRAVGWCVETFPFEVAPKPSSFSLLLQQWKLLLLLLSLQQNVAGVGRISKFHLIDCNSIFAHFHAIAVDGVKIDGICGDQIRRMRVTMNF